MDVVTGSFGYIGKYITKELIPSGRSLKTITTHPDKPNPFGEMIYIRTGQAFLLAVRRLTNPESGALPGAGILTHPCPSAVNFDSLDLLAHHRKE